MPQSESESPRGDEKGGAGGSLPRRGARACVSCRRGKNRCINEGGEPPCKRCAANGLQCVFETPVGGKTVDEERVERLERTMSSLASTVESLSGLIRSSGLAGGFPNPPAFTGNGAHLLHPLHSGSPPGQGPSRQRQQQQPMRLDNDFNARSPANPMHWDHSIIPHENTLGPLLSQSPHLYHQHDAQPPTIPPIPSVSFSVATPTSRHSYSSTASLKRARQDSLEDSVRREHPPLPNYRAPPHPISQYGLVPSTVPSDDEDNLPTASLTAPFEALAEAAAAAASGGDANGGSGSVTPSKRKRRRRRNPPPPNAFPDVVEKGLVEDAVARQIFSFYFAHCHRFFAILDERDDTYEAMRQRTPWAVDSILATASARILDPTQEIQIAAEHAAEEAQGIARSSLFGPTVRKEGVQAMALLAAFSPEGYLAAGHALRMALELGLHRALEKIAEGADKGKVRREDEEKDLLVSARIFLCLYWLDFVLSTGTGRPHYCDEDLVSSEKMAALLRHPLSLHTDVSLVANIELISCRSRIEGMMSRAGPSFDSKTVETARRAGRDLQNWHRKWDTALGERYEEASFERRSLECALHSAQIFLAAIALKGSNLGDVENLSVDARELAMTARQASVDLIELWMTAPSLRESIRYATQNTFVELSFSALLLLKLSRLFPEGGSLQLVVNQCHALQALLRQFPGAERFAITVMVALERFSKAFSLSLPLAAPPESSNGAGADYLSNGGLGSVASQFDVSSLPVFSDPNWVGNDTVPEWLNDPLAWSFTDLDLSAGLGSIFLPSWSTQVDATLKTRPRRSEVARGESRGLRRLADPEIFAHKCIIFARSSGSFQQRYLIGAGAGANNNRDTNDSTLSLPFSQHQQQQQQQQAVSRRSVTPSNGRDYSDSSQFMRSPSPASMLSFASSAPSQPLSLAGTDPAVFQACLEHFYSGSEGGVTVLFEGFDEGVREGEPELKGVDKLRSDCLFMWRSRLYGDMTIALDDSLGSVFAAHKAVLASRSPYFAALLLGNYADSAQSTFTLPSPPFTAASTLFILGYIYSGTLSFGNRSFDLATALDIWRGAAYLQLALLQEDVEDRIEKMITLVRAARVYSFALAPEVGSQRLARAATPFVVDRFSEVWSCKEIGNLEYPAQKKLVSAVCAKINPAQLTTVAKGSFALRKRLELEKAAWASHVRAMLDAIDEQLKKLIGRSLTEVVASTGFVELVDGIGFSSDVLEFVLEMAVGSLTEAKAPEAYQSLVGSVLLREEGILMDARVLVEDAKVGIIKYIKRKSNAIKLAKGFDGLESWALKELSDARGQPQRAHLASRIYSLNCSIHPSTTRRRLGCDVDHSARVDSHHPDGDRLASYDGTSNNRRGGGKDTATFDHEHGFEGRASCSGRGGEHDILGADPDSIGIHTSPNDLASLALRSRLATSTLATTSLTPSSNNSRRSESTHHDCPDSPHHNPSRLSRSKTRTRARADLERVLRPPNAHPVHHQHFERDPFHLNLHLGSPCHPPNPSSSASIKGKEPATPPTTLTPRGTAPAPRRPSSAASTKTATDSLRRPASSASIRSVSSVRAPVAPPPSAPTIRRPASSNSVKTASPKQPATVKVLVGGRRPSVVAAAAAAASTPKPPLPTTAPALPTGLPGTTLLSGIPCIVTVAADKPTRFRATVRYIGQVLWTNGQWIGIEVAESAIPDEARDLDWNDGSVAGRQYFDIKPPTTSRAGSSGRVTPVPVDLPDGHSGGSGSNASLRPPSRRARRSSSSDAVNEPGPRKGLFVLPNQIVYVL
ncbi:hypothetical protein RQP46_008632 [Phenoliferia psychrophenolica]